MNDKIPIVMKIIKENKKATNIVVKSLSEGKLVFMASETVYIAAVDATNLEAVKKLVLFKNRPFGKPFSIGVIDISMAKNYVEINNTANKIYKRFLPGPVTVISKGKHKVASGVEAENGTLGIRIPDYKFFQEVIKKFKKPITTTSANASYQKRPYKLTDILDNISEKQKGLIDLMIDAGELPHNEPSTVIDTTIDDTPIVLRQGDIKLKDKNEILSRSEENTQNLAKELWQKYEDFKGKRALIFALEGKMGVGKTQFVKGLARAMGIDEIITSPSYDLEYVYESKIKKNKLVHMDTWRMINPTEEIINLDTKKLINDKSIIAIEWADRIVDTIRTFAEDAIVVWVKINYGNNTNDRIII